MKKIAFIFVLGLFPILPAQAEDLIGQISKASNGEILLNEPYSNKVFILKMSPKFSKYTDSFIGHKTFLRFSGKISNDTFHAERTPTLTSAPSRLEGLLNFANDQFFIGQHPVKFETAMKVNGTSFDNKSINFFLHKKVIVNGTFIGENFQISSLVPADLYSANLNHFAPEGLHSKFSKNPLKYISEILPQNKYSQSELSFKGTILGKGKQVREADYALIITLSGRQGDDLGSVNGHYASGMAKVNKDLSLDMELNNYYPPINEKNIIPGVIDYVDYFGGLTSGQANYRPTYTLVIYGMNPEQLIKMRDSLDSEFANLRLGEDNFSAKHNCTTVSNDGLSVIGLLEKRNLLSKPHSSLSELKDSIGKNPSYYFPRAAFDEFLRNLKTNLKDNTTAYRVDFIFQNQTPSARKLGGISADELAETLKYRLKEERHKKRPYSRKEMWNVLNEVD